MSTQAGADQPPTNPAPTSGEIGEERRVGKSVQDV